MLKWYEISAPHQDIVLSSRIRLARNVCDFPFQNKMDDSQRAALTAMVRDALEGFLAGGDPLRFLQMEQMNEIERYSMVENHSISPEFAKNAKNRMLGLSVDDSVSIMVNEEDHLRIQVMANGLNLSAAYQTANEIDDVLDRKLNYAFDERLGFLTTCPTNLGTGLRASVMVHLPALEKSGLINQLTSTVNKLGLTIRGTYGEGSKVLGAIYQISNQITLGITEHDAIQNLESIVLQVIESEKSARDTMLQQKYQTEDMIWRSYGKLKYARMISSQEFFEEISNIRLGASLGILDDVSCCQLNRLMNVTGTSAVCREKGRKLPPNERDYLRAQTIRRSLSHNKQPE